MANAASGRSDRGPTEPDEAGRHPGTREAGPPPAPLPLPATGFVLSVRERLVAAELERIDPQLAGLFRIGLELCSRGDIPGHSYVIAEAGRELSVGIINFLTEGAPELTHPELATIAADEKHRGPIARALRLHPQDPLVSAWLDMHQRFNGEAHFVANRVAASTAASDFRELASLIAGRIAPYFDAQDEADAVLAIGRPGPEHLDAVRRILVRPALRRYFLQKLQDPEWLPLLEQLHAFDRPPSRIVHSDRSWSMAAWLEGEYLVGVAAVAPHAVGARIEAIPVENDNPAVWDAAARAAAALPAELAARALRHIAMGLRSLPRVVLPTALLTLGEHVAAVDPGAVLLLLNTLLWMRRRETEADSTREDEPLRYSYSTAWLLERIDMHDAQDTLDRLVPAIADVDPRGVLKLLGEKLRAAMRAIDPAYANETARATRWYVDLDESETSNDLRALITRAIARVATVYASTNATNASWVVEFLSTLPKGIGQRLVYLILSKAAPHLTNEVDALLRRPDLLEWDMPGREVGEVLRQRFSDADIGAQRAFLQTLEQGPGEDQLKHIMDWAERTEQDASREGALAYWQRRQLRRFGVRLPAVLSPLAERLSYTPAEPDPRELDLIEIGWSSGSAGWVREKSPFSTESLMAGPPDNVARSVLDWVPDGGVDRPTLRGLDEAMQELADSAPDRAIEISTAILRAGSSRGVSGVLWGLARRFKRGADTPIASLTDLFRKTLASALARPEWDSLITSAIDLARDVILAAAPECAAEFFDLSARLLADPRLWQADEDGEPETMDAVLSAAINVLSGRTTELAIRFAMAEYNHRRNGYSDDSDQAAAIRSEIANRLLPAIRTVLSKSGSPAIAARAVIGTYLPQLVWFSPEWWSSQATALFDGAVENPTKNPIWAAYLTRASFFDSTFARLRPWYAMAIANPIRISDAAESRTWEPERHLVEHVLVAVLRGLARVGEDDCLVENTFAHAPVDDLSHGFWTIFRGWSDAAAKGDNPPSEYVTRLIELWTWRLSQLEDAAESPRRAAEANGLLWLCRTPGIPLKEVIALGVRTLRLVRDASGTLHLLWERLGELAATDPDGTYLMMERAVEIELASKWPRVPDKELGAVFSAVFSNGSASTQAAALRLLNKLGDAGHPEFGRFRPVL